MALVGERNHAGSSRWKKRKIFVKGGTVNKLFHALFSSLKANTCQISRTGVCSYTDHFRFDNFFFGEKAVEVSGQVHKMVLQEKYIGET